jgi:hypothetical protein
VKLADSFALFSWSVCCCLSLVACVSDPPLEDYSLSRSAYDAAREAEAPRYAPALWYKAEETYKQAQLLYKQRDYDEAKAEFIEARVLLEKSENVARTARLQSGGVPP